jgi:hypothetical protein
MSFVFFYTTLLDAGIAAPLVGLPCVPNDVNGVNLFVATTPPVPIYLPNAGYGVDVQTLTEQL